MHIEKIELDGLDIGLVRSPTPVITDADSALQLLVDAHHGLGCHCVAVEKSAVCEDFFKLSTGLAGEILQKFVNYRLRFAIIGDFSEYTSKPLKDFIYESNRGGHIFFVASLDEASEHFKKAE